MLDVGNQSVPAGELKTGVIEGVELNTTNRVDVPMLAMNGAEEGPTFLLFSTQHGIELQGAGVIHTIMHDCLDPEQLKGSVIGIPVANPLAYMAHTYRSWIDNGDVGYVTTDQPNGNTTERLANAIWEEVWSKSDLIANIHCNTRPDSLIFSWIRVEDETEEDLERMASAFDVTTMRSESAVAGAGIDPLEGDVPPTLRNRGAMNGIPELTVELIDSRWLSEPSQTIGTRGLLNIMKEYNMIDGDFESQEGIKKVPDKYCGGSGYNRFAGKIRANKGGIYHPKKEPGTLVEEGEVIAEVVNLQGESVEEVRMPQEGYVWAYPGGQTFATSGALQVIETGGLVAFTFEHEKA